MSNFKFQRSFCIILVLLPLNSTKIQCHTKGIRPKNSTTMQLNTNMTQTQLAEQQYMKWVRFVGKLKHSAFSPAKNKLFPSYTLTVSKNPATGDFTSIQDAIDSLPFINLVRLVIKVNAGVYTISHVGINDNMRNFVGRRFRWCFLGYYVELNKNTKWVLIRRENFCREKVNIPQLKQFITIEGAGADNTIVQWGDTAKTTGPKGQPIGTYNSATFAVNSAYFIAKNITFKGCHVHAIAQNMGALTAQSRNSLMDDTGFSFVNCEVTASGALYLGRAWGPFSRVIFAYTYMGNIIIPEGWYNWGDPNRELTLFHGQYKCTGPGANFAGRVSWSRELTDEEAKPSLIGLYWER
ncbi:Pectinesterase, catalytic [Dillenia turbinata]|uniref:pectinesterase n=1 Tax=Dillenia turbinata TaxID=194707 RepID=A0AAN8ZL33_9MAGN